MKKLLLFLAALALVVAAVVTNKLMDTASVVPEVIQETIEVMVPPEPTTVTREAIVKSIEEKMEVTTISLKLEAYVITGKCSEGAIKAFFTNDCLTMLVPGRVKAGFDWEGFTPDQVETTDDEVVVTISSFKIFDVIIDHSKIASLSYDDGLFVINPDMNLQGRGLAKAKLDLRKDACKNEILKLAALSAEKNLGDNLRTFLHAAGDVRMVRIISNIPVCK